MKNTYRDKAAVVSSQSRTFQPRFTAATVATMMMAAHTTTEAIENARRRSRVHGTSRSPNCSRKTTATDCSTARSTTSAWITSGAR